MRGNNFYYMIVQLNIIPAMVATFTGKLKFTGLALCLFVKFIAWI